MRLVGLTIENFRSVTQARRLKLHDVSVLVGPNNEGKSNILRALVTAMEIIARHAVLPLRTSTAAPSPQPKGPVRIPTRLIARQLYEWERDFPIRLQDTKPEGRSVFTLEFLLTSGEITQFKQEVGSNLNGTLPIQISINETDTQIKVTKKGTGGTALTKKSPAIARFVSNRISLQYIPAVRTAEKAMAVIYDMVSQELGALETVQEYKDALAKIDELQKPKLDAIANRIKTTLAEFLPRVTSVSVGASKSRQRYAMTRAFNVEIDDGTPTLLEHKGDGVQSLAALALMRQQAGSGGQDYVVAIEEPESHLHPGAIHALRAVLADLARTYQVVLTTHCPLFVERRRVAANILVRDNKARPAKNIEELREARSIRGEGGRQPEKC